MLKKIRAYKVKLAAKYGQIFADHIITMLKQSKYEFEFNYWFNFALTLELVLYCNYGIELE